MKSALDTLAELQYRFQSEKGQCAKYFLVGTEAKMKLDAEFNQLIYAPKGDSEKLLISFRGIAILEVLPPYPADRIEVV